MSKWPKKICFCVDVFVYCLIFLHWLYWRLSITEIVYLFNRLLWRELVSTSCWPGSMLSSRSVSSTFHLGGPSTTSLMSQTCAVHVTPLISGLILLRWSAVHLSVFYFSSYIVDSLFLLQRIYIEMFDSNSCTYRYFRCPRIALGHCTVMLSVPQPIILPFTYMQLLIWNTYSCIYCQT